MIQDAVIRSMEHIVGKENLLQEEGMNRHTTFRVGGPAEVLVRPSSIEQITELTTMLQQLGIPFLLLGNGSNVLVGDGGIRGVVIQLGDGFAECSVEGTVMTAQAGIKLSRLAATAMEHRLTGLEFAAGIPGTLGGALYMNAGAYGGEMKQVVEEVTYLNAGGEVCRIGGADCHFGYRTSIFEEDPDLLILGCRLRLAEGDKAEIRGTMDELAKQRMEKQPLNFPSAGSTFKRPQGAFAGKLIQDAGLMGFRVGGASVSEKHAGFVVNDQNATAKEIQTLIQEVQRRVQEDSGFLLEPEVRFLGEFL